MKANNTIHINGKLYDARTGELIVKPEPSVPEKEKVKVSSAATTPKAHTTKSRRGNGFVDGLARNPNAPAQAVVKKQPTKVSAQPKHNNVVHTPAQKAVFKTKHTQTLHRSSVHKPRLESPQATTAKTVGKKTSQPSQQRVERALMTPRSKSIHKFNSHTQVSPMQKALVSAQENSGLSIANIVHAAEKVHDSRKSQHVKHELIAKTLAEANTQNNQVKKHKAKKAQLKGFHYVAGGLAALVLAGYVAYLNVPSLSMKVASSRAGFAASLPSSPAGYSMRGPIAYNPGQVIINFGSSTDERRFSIQQQPTTWDSAALKENYVSKATTAEPITYQDRGLTIYIYNGGDAAWVNSGKFYNIKATNAQLDTKQILDIATSM